MIIVSYDHEIKVNIPEENCFLQFCWFQPNNCRRFLHNDVMHNNMTSQTDTDCATSQYVYLINRYVYVMLGSSWSEYLHILRIIVSNECVPLTHEIFMNTHSKFIIWKRSRTSFRRLEYEVTDASGFFLLAHVPELFVNIHIAKVP